MKDYNKEELERLILEDNLPYEEIGRRYGMTGAGIKKAAKRLGIELPVRRCKSDTEHFNKGAERYCISCGNLLATHQEKYCCKKCQMDYQYKEAIRKWRNGEWGGTANYTASDHLKRYLLDKYNYKCQKCGWGELNVYTSKVPLQVHHIDGDGTNNSENNLELLCPNCHSLTDNYGSRNTNCTRPKRST